MAEKHSEEFWRDAVQIALTSGLSRKQVAADLGVGVSTLGKWISRIRAEGDARLPDADVLKELEQLRKENRVLREEREVLKKATAFFAGLKK